MAFPEDPQGEGEEGIIIATDTVLDGGATSERFRQEADLAAGNRNAEVRQRLELAKYQFRQIIEELCADARVNKGVQGALNKEKAILDTAALVHSFMMFLTLMDQVLERFGESLEVDGETLQPVFSTGNTSTMIERLGFAAERFRMMPEKITTATSARHAELSQATRPSEVFGEDMLQFYSIEGATTNPNYVLRLVDAVDRFLTSTLQATQLGMSATINQTSAQVHALYGTAQTMHTQAEEAEAFMMSLPPDQMIELVRACEMVFAQCIGNMSQVHGINLQMAAQELNPETVDRLIREFIRLQNDLQEKAKNPPQLAEPGFFDRLANLVRAKAPDAPRQTAAERRKEIDDIGRSLAELRALKKYKKDQK